MNISNLQDVTWITLRCVGKVYTNKKRITFLDNVTKFEKAY